MKSKTPCNLHFITARFSSVQLPNTAILLPPLLPPPPPPLPPFPTYGSGGGKSTHQLQPRDRRA
eukprot:7204276-Pyramimonas_sp.AAC.1